MTTDEKLNHLSDFLQYNTDIICNNPDYWMSGFHKNYLPTFDYYLKNCVLDKEGPYDYTKRKYSSHSQVLIPTIDYANGRKRTQMKLCQRKIYSTVKYSYWKGTPFNYKQVIEAV